MKNKIVKVVAWRCISVCITMVVFYIVTGDIKSATGITLLLHSLLTACHFFFESLWERVYENESR